MTVHWDSVLAITDRGAYNKGSNSANVVLIMTPPNYNKSNLNLPPTDWSFQPLWWALESSAPTWQPGENGTVGDSFSFTTTKLSDFFSFEGTLSEELNAEWATYTNENISLPGTCNSSYYNGNYTLSISQLPGDEWSATRGWTDYKVPSVNVTFDENTANLTVEGKFSASPYTRAKDTNYIGGWWAKGEIDDNAMIQGTIRLTFRGALDTYHSDVLDMNTTMSTWLRTVGFGHNSRNAGYPSGGLGRSGVVAGVIVVLFSIFAMFI